MKIIKTILLAPFMIIIVPLDYFCWNYFVGNDPDMKEVTFKESCQNCWAVISK